MGFGTSKSKGPYSVPIHSAMEVNGETPAYRRPENKEKLLTTPDASITTLQQMYEVSFKKYGSRKLYGERVRKPDGKLGGYEYLTFNQVYDKTLKLGQSIEDHKLYSEGKTVIRGVETHLRLVGVYGRTSLEWSLIDVACCLFGLTTVPMYDTLGEEGLQYIFETTNMKVCFVRSELIGKIVNLKKANKTSGLTEVIMMNSDVKPEDLKKLEETGLGVRLLNGLIEAAGPIQERRKVLPNDLYTFCYTSGTTGMPKAAMISHRNMLAGVVSASSTDEFLKGEEVIIAFLPMAHSMERIAHAYKISKGYSSPFYSGDTLKITEDVQFCKPTTFVAVPRILNKMVDGIKAKIDGMPAGMTKNLAQTALNSKLKNVRQSGEVKSLVYDKLVFNKVKQLLGGNVEIIVTGSAPITQEVNDLTKAAFCSELLQGYGLTETCASGFVTRPGDNVLSVGGPSSTTEFKLVDIPEMNYFSKDTENGVLMPRGEIWIRSAHVFEGYYNQPDKSAEALTNDGWLRTGDVGSILPNGALRIIDRKKNIFKLSQGEYIAPEKLEAVFLKTPGVAEIFVYGDSNRSHLVAVVVPDEPSLLKVAQEIGVSGDLETISKDQKIKDKLMKDMAGLGAAAKFTGLERIKGLHIDPCTTFGNRGILTTSLKLKRHDARVFYQDAIDQLYSQTP